MCKNVALEAGPLAGLQKLVFKNGFAPFLTKTSKNCQGKMNKKIR